MDLSSQETRNYGYGLLTVLACSILNEPIGNNFLRKLFHATSGGLLLWAMYGGKFFLGAFLGPCLTVYCVRRLFKRFGKLVFATYAILIGYLAIL